MLLFAPSQNSTYGTPLHIVRPEQISPSLLMRPVLSGVIHVTGDKQDFKPNSKTQLRRGGGGGGEKVQRFVLAQRTVVTAHAVAQF